MKNLAITIGAALAPLLVVSAASSQSVVTSPAAPSTTVVQAQPAVVASAPRETSGPNAMLFKSGLFVFVFLMARRSSSLPRAAVTKTRTSDTRQHDGRRQARGRLAS